MWYGVVLFCSNLLASTLQVFCASFPRFKKNFVIISLSIFLGHLFMPCPLCLWLITLAFSSCPKGLVIPLLLNCFTELYIFLLPSSPLPFLLFYCWYLIFLYHMSVQLITPPPSFTVLPPTLSSEAFNCYFIWLWGFVFLKLQFDSLLIFDLLLNTFFISFVVFLFYSAVYLYYLNSSSRSFYFSYFFS